MKKLLIPMAALALLGLAGCEESCYCAADGSTRTAPAGLCVFYCPYDSSGHERPL